MGSVGMREERMFKGKGKMQLAFPCLGTTAITAAARTLRMDPPGLTQNLNRRYGTERKLEGVLAQCVCACSWDCVCVSSVQLAAHH